MHAYFKILGKLTKTGIRYGVVGLMGASFYGSDQTTYDLDIFVEPDEKTLSKVRALLKKEGLAEAAVCGGELVKPSPTNREIIDKKITLLFVDSGGLTIDVLTSVSGLDFKKLWKRHKPFVIDGQKIYAASLEDIIMSKSKANRTKDSLHLPRLRKLLKEKTAKSAQNS
ncbi:MAG: nucleotidyltransferase [Deltaproteobacteria bacterium]|nr:nucleotidyltransferase [Deltaproteobacteria bacterium]